MDTICKHSRCEDNIRVLAQSIVLGRIFNNFPTCILHVYPITEALVFWYLVHIFNTIIANFWDLAMDWAFLRVWDAPNYGLREDLEFKHRWVYYFAICSNTLMRFVWVTDKKHKVVITVVLAFIEVFR